MVKIDKIPDRAFARVYLDELGTLGLKPLQLLPEIILTNDKSKKQFYVIQVVQFRDAFIIRDDMKKFEHLLQSLLDILKKKIEETFNVKPENPKITIDHDYFIISKGTSGKEVKSLYKEIDIDRRKLIAKIVEYERGFSVFIPLCIIFSMIYDMVYQNYVDVSNLV